MNVVPGQTLGQYRIIEQIGRGGMATVYKAFQPSLNRHVAIKVLPSFFAEDPNFLERFRQEALTIANLHHPNILSVIDYGEEGGTTYLVSALEEGGTLANRLGQPLPLDECMRLLRPIASALDYAHSRQVVHRDVKPSNILLTEDGTPILSDFGLARMMASSRGETAMERLTATGTAVGTPEYMAPEQLSNGGGGAPADIYGLAVVLYEMLTGTVPFSAETPLAVALAHINNALPLPRERNPDIPETVQDVVLRGLAKRPEDRYATAGEMANALEDALYFAASSVADGRRVPATAASVARRPAGLYRGIGGGIAAVVLVGAIVSWLQLQPRRGPIALSQEGGLSSAAVSAAPSSAPGAEVAKPSVAASSSVSTAPAVPAKPFELPPHGDLLYELKVAPPAANIAPSFLKPEADKVRILPNAVELEAAPSGRATVSVPSLLAADFVAEIRAQRVSGQGSYYFNFRRDQNAYEELLVGTAGGTVNLSLLRPGNPSPTKIKDLIPTATYIQPATTDEVVFVVSATGPETVLNVNGNEVGRSTDSSTARGDFRFGANGSASVTAPFIVRLSALKVYAGPGAERRSARASAAASGNLAASAGASAAVLASAPVTSAEPARGRLLWGFDPATALGALSPYYGDPSAADLQILNDRLRLSATATSRGSWAGVTIRGLTVKDFVATMKATQSRDGRTRFIFRARWNPDGTLITYYGVDVWPVRSVLQIMEWHPASAGGERILASVPQQVPNVFDLNVVVQGEKVTASVSDRELAVVDHLATDSGGIRFETNNAPQGATSVMQVLALSIYAPAE